MTRLNYCYDCHQAHWAADCPKRNPPHIVTDTVTYPGPDVTKPVTITPNVALVTHAVTKHCPTCKCGKVYKSNAEKQRAYRARHKSDQLVQRLIDKRNGP